MPWKGQNKSIINLILAIFFFILFLVVFLIPVATTTILRLIKEQACLILCTNIKVPSGFVIALALLIAIISIYRITTTVWTFVLVIYDGFCCMRVFWGFLLVGVTCWGWMVLWSSLIWMIGIVIAPIIRSVIIVKSALFKPPLICVFVTSWGIAFTMSPSTTAYLLIISALAATSTSILMKIPFKTVSFCLYPVASLFICGLFLFIWARIVNICRDWVPASTILSLTVFSIPCVLILSVR